MSERIPLIVRMFLTYNKHQSVDTAADGTVLCPVAIKLFVALSPPPPPPPNAAVIAFSRCTSAHTVKPNGICCCCCCVARRVEAGVVKPNDGAQLQTQERLVSSVGFPITAEAVGIGPSW